MKKGCVLSSMKALTNEFKETTNDCWQPIRAFVVSLNSLVNSFGFNDVSDKSPPSGLPRWLAGFCATENRYQFQGSAKTGEPLGQAQWGCVGSVISGIQQKKLGRK